MTGPAVVQIEPWGERSYHDINRVIREGIGFAPPPEEPDRVEKLVHRPWSFLAVDEGTVVGVTGAYRFGMSVPGGGEVQTVGTTVVAVFPTHRRQGLLRRMMGPHLDAARADGCALAALWASETPIYGRFGFGLGSDRGEWRIQARRARPRPLNVPGRVRLHTVDEATDAMKVVYERHRHDRAGMLSRTDKWWAIRRLDDAEWQRGGYSEYAVALYSVGDDPQGYLQYRRKSHWVDGIPKDEILIWELMGSDEARRALWHYVLSIDLVETVMAYDLPVDALAPVVVEDRRRAVVVAQDALWVRVMNVPTVLSARRYRAAGDLVFRIEPCECARAGEDSGTFRLSGGPDGADCRQTDETPQMTTSLADFSTLAFGADTARRLRAAGRLTADDQTVDRIDLMFGTTLAPWCPERF